MHLRQFSTKTKSKPNPNRSALHLTVFLNNSKELRVVFQQYNAKLNYGRSVLNNLSSLAGGIEVNSQTKRNPVISAKMQSFAKTLTLSSTYPFFVSSLDLIYPLTQCFHAWLLLRSCPPSISRSLMRFIMLLTKLGSPPDLLPTLELLQTRSLGTRPSILIFGIFSHLILRDKLVVKYKDKLIINISFLFGKSCRQYVYVWSFTTFAPSSGIEIH